MKTLTLILSVMLLSSCAGAKLKTEMTEQRGYSKEDTEAIVSQAQEYNKGLIMASHQSNAFNTAPTTNAEAKLKTIFCNCRKKLGDKCGQKSDGLAGADKDLWLKANAADMAFAMGETAMDAGPSRRPDPVECQ